MATISERLRLGVDNPTMNVNYAGDANRVMFEAADTIDALVAALKEARAELEDCLIEMTGESYNNPRINAALALTQPKE